MQNDQAQKTSAALGHYVPPQWAADAADLALFRDRVRPSPPRDLTKARHFYSGPNGNFVEGLRACRADQFCRCRACKPPLSQVKAMRQLRVTVLVASAIILALLLASVL